MIVCELISKLKKMKQDEFIRCQVVANNGDVWYCGFDIEYTEHSSMVVLNVNHPKLTHLPDLKEKL